jgi:hypothetical protein
VADALLQQRLGWSVLSTRKAVQLVANGVPILCFAALCVTSSPSAATTLLSLAIASSSLSHSGYSANLIDICGGCPQLTGVLMGVVNSVGTLPGILASWLTGRMLTGEGTQEEWATVFMLAIGIYAAGLAAFLVGAQAHDIFGPSRAERLDRRSTAVAHVLLPVASMRSSS